MKDPFETLREARYDGETPLEFFKRIGYEGHRFIRACSFAGELINCSSYITSVFDKDHGKCFIFNAAQSGVNKLAQTTAGVGLSLVIDVWSDEYPDKTGHRTMFNGVLLKLGAAVDPTSPYEVLLQPGQLTKIALKQNTVILANMSGGGGVDQSCSHNSRQLKMVSTDQTGGYSRGLCVFDCMQSAMMHFCGCIIPMDPFFLQPHHANSTVCTNTNHSSCTRAITKDYGDLSASDLDNATLKNARQEISSCGRECHEACNLAEYSIATSSLSFPAPFFCPPISSNNNPEEKSAMTYGTHHTNCDEFEMKLNYIIVDIAFGTMSHTIVRQRSAMTFNTFISNLGGQLGLWVGASLFTIIQFVVFVITSIVESR